ncbi:hypothetical protein BDN70DRAFT_617264 [Pholiota conissans]|uniref:Uncharacterized protein n=1 Tax=Pholiota conissans TaxID=109636 RepID=A0A9P6CLC2_9AGAR|nr:hypothetical protein BDN70DRAFT_617264 [Pholiota conissans]
MHPSPLPPSLSLLSTILAATEPSSTRPRTHHAAPSRTSPLHHNALRIRVRTSVGLGSGWQSFHWVGICAGCALVFAESRELVDVCVMSFI